MIIDEAHQDVNSIHVWVIKLIQAENQQFGIEIGITDKYEYTLQYEGSGYHYFYASDGDKLGSTDD